MPTITALFETRREAELAVEHLVQQHEIERNAIMIGPDGDANSVGLIPSGSDQPAVGEDADNDEAALNGSILVSVTVAGDDTGEAIESVLNEYGGSGVSGAV